MALTVDLRRLTAFSFSLKGALRQLLVREILGRRGHDRVDDCALTVLPNCAPSCQNTINCLSWSAHVGITRLVTILGELGPPMLVASTMVPVLIFRPLVLQRYQRAQRASRPRDVVPVRENFSTVLSGGAGSRLRSMSAKGRRRESRGLFHHWIREIEPALQKIDSQHAFKPTRRAFRALVWG